jgi:hypothetical protein
MPAFAKAFGCKAGQPMAGGHVWYRDPWHGVALTRDQRKDVLQGYWMDALFWRFGLAKGDKPPVALIDSLAADSTASPVPGFHRLARLAAQQLGDYRAGLPPEERARLDPFLRYWVRDRALAGFKDVTIPGLYP